MKQVQQSFTIGGVFNLLMKILNTGGNAIDNGLSMVDNVTGIGARETELWKTLHESSVTERMSEAELKLRQTQSKIASKLEKLNK